MFIIFCLAALVAKLRRQDQKCADELQAAYRLHYRKIAHYPTAEIRYDGPEIRCDGPDSATPGAGMARDIIVMIPGNPGDPIFYNQFLRHLGHLLDWSHGILSISNANTYPCSSNKNKCPLKQVYLLADQVQHKVAYINTVIEQHPSSHLILIGHSIGCFMVLQVLRALA